MSVLATKAVPKNCGSKTAVAVPVVVVSVVSVEYSTTSSSSNVVLLYCYYNTDADYDYVSDHNVSQINNCLFFIELSIDYKTSLCMQ